MIFHNISVSYRQWADIPTTSCADSINTYTNERVGKGWVYALTAAVRRDMMYDSQSMSHNTI